MDQVKRGGVQLEPVLWVAGMRALLLQSLHPRVMRGTFQNSALFDPKKAWPRFQRTVGFVGTRTFGTHDDVEAAGARVRRMHATLKGRAPDGTSFALDDPENLLWVHNAEIKIPAGIDVELMFTEGALLLERVSGDLPKRSDDRKTIDDAVTAIRDTSRPEPVRYSAAASPAVDDVLAPALELLDLPIREPAAIQPAI